MAGYQLNLVLCVTAVMVAWSHLAALSLLRLGEIQ
jgi:hypothetical protein